MLVIYGTEIPKESVILFGIKLDEDGKLKVSQKQVKRVIKEMRSGLRCVFGNSSCWVKFKRCIHVLFRLAFGHVRRFTSVKFDFNKKSKMEFYPVLSGKFP